MNKQTWINNITQQLGAGASKALTERIVDAALVEITAALSKGEFLRLPHIGTLATKRTTPRNGRDPRTGAAIKIPARTKVTFSASSVLKDAVQPKAKAATAMKPKAGKPKPKPKAKAKKA